MRFPLPRLLALFIAAHSAVADPPQLTNGGFEDGLNGRQVANPAPLDDLGAKLDASPL